MEYFKIFGGISILFFLPLISAFLFLRFSFMRKAFFFPIGSGVILSVVFLRVLPEAIYETDIDIMPFFVLFGVILSVLLDKINFLKKEHISKESLACWECEDPFSYKVSIGLGVHYMIDGFFLGGFLLSAKNYLVILMLVAVHKFLDGFILSLIYSGHNLYRAMKFIFIVSLSNLMGFILAILGLNFSEVSFIFAPISAGILIYVAIHDFIPVLNSTSDFILFILGVLLSGVLIRFASFAH
jgi:ZIP family zinc transporter